MTARELTAYALIAAMLIVLACWIAWTRHNSPERKYGRQRKRDLERYQERLDSKETGPDSRESDSG